MGPLIGSGGMAFATAISLIPARSVDPEITARLSGFVQPVGYIRRDWTVRCRHVVFGIWLLDQHVDLVDGHRCWHVRCRGVCCPKYYRG